MIPTVDYPGYRLECFVKCQVIGCWTGLQARRRRPKRTDGNRRVFPLRWRLARRWAASSVPESSVGGTYEGRRKGCVNSGGHRKYSQGRDDAASRSSSIHLDPWARTNLWPSDSVAEGRRHLFWCSASCAYGSLYRLRGGARRPRPRICSLVLYCDARREWL